MESYIHDTIALPEILDGPVSKSYLKHANARSTAMVKADGRQENGTINVENLAQLQQLSDACAYTLSAREHCRRILIAKPFLESF
jgi:hypothetical protein